MEDNGTIEIPKGKLVGCNWLVVKKLGEGGCGSVYLVKSLEDDSEAAMKCESNFASGGCVLKLEVAILKKLANKKHVAQLLGAARVTQYSYVVMTLLGESMNKIVKRLNRAVTVSTQCRIAANMLFCMKQIHDIGFIHRDLKPANMALGKKGTSECRFFHILDFGLARQYAVPSNNDPNRMKMRRPRDRALFRGTTRYCSIRMHDRAEQGRVDDLWSMIYLLAELRGPLPWATQSDKRIVGEMKRLHTDEVILQNSPTEFLEIAAHLRTLTYFHRPDYFKIYMLIMAVMEKGRFEWDDPFDWEFGTTTKSLTPNKTRTPRKLTGPSPNRSTMSKEMTNQSKETTNKSKENASTPAKGESFSKEKMSTEIVGSNPSKEKEEYTPVDKERKAEMMIVLPFDPDFFQQDPIGF
ncbi:unnamed protein product [Caenorhabditis angaria]|uniref:Protein kinase domain-containing protein n=1 Tax=Caenorhabditis angaria TaxID=860376 RepID=A0A9P1IA51_9PELO|nr:unnamed protein product [Caenorhabditis angaria]